MSQITPVTVKTRVSLPPPQMLVEFEHCYGTHQTLSDGTELWQYRERVAVVLKKKTDVTEYRGYNDDPSENLSNSVQYANYTVLGTNNENLGTVTYAASETTYECMRINEAGMWRIIKTETTATPERQVVSA